MTIMVEFRFPFFDGWKTSLERKFDWHGYSVCIEKADFLYFGFALKTLNMDDRKYNVLTIWFLTFRFDIAKSKNKPYWE